MMRDVKICCFCYQIVTKEGNLQRECEMCELGYIAEGGETEGGTATLTFYRPEQMESLETGKG